MDSKNFQIRKANRNDVTTILLFIKDLAEFEKLSHEVVANEKSIEKYIFEQQKAHVIIAELALKPIGFALFFENFSTFLGLPGIYLEDLYIQPAFRGRGYGSRLLEHLAQHTRAKGYGRLEWSVLNWNEKAIKLYEKMGAKPQKNWTVYRLEKEALQKLGD